MLDGHQTLEVIHVFVQYGKMRDSNSVWYVGRVLDHGINVDVLLPKRTQGVILEDTLFPRSTLHDLR